MTPHKQPLWSRSVAAALAMSMGLDVTGCRIEDPDAILAEVRQARDRGDLRAAVSQLRSLIEQQGHHAGALVLLGELCLDQGDLPAATGALRQAASLGGDGGGAAQLLAQTLMAQGQFEQVLACIDPAPAPVQRPVALALRGQALLGLHDHGGAEALISQALLLNAECADALLGQARLALSRGDAPAAASSLRRALVGNPGHAACVRLQADLLRTLGKLPQARAAHDSLLERRPCHAQTLVDLAHLDIQAGELAAARHLLGQASRLAGAGLPVLHAQALACLRSGQRAQAEEIAHRTLRGNPSHGPTLLLAGALSMERDHGRAQACLEKFLRLYPAHAYATSLMATMQLAAGHPESALSLLSPLLSGDTAGIGVLTLAAEAALQAHDFNRASILFTRASLVPPEPAPGVRMLALSRMGEHDQLRQIDEVERALLTDSDAPRPAVLTALVYLHNRQPERAMEVLAQQPRDASTPLLLDLEATLQLERKDARNARTTWNSALAMDPTFLPALGALERLDRAEGRPPEATRNRYLSALAAAPGSADIMEALAHLARSRHHRTEAMAWMERACQEHPASLALALRTGALYLELGEAGRARALALAAQARHPEHAQLLCLLGEASLATRDFATATEAFQRLAAMQPHTGLPHARMAAVLVAMEDDAAALAALRRALRIEPDLAEARTGLVRLLIRHARHGEALAVALAAQHRQPDLALGYALEGDVHAHQRQHGPACDAYRLAFTFDPAPAALLAWFGSLSAMGRSQEADAVMTEWLATHPADVPVRYHYASAKLAAGDLAGAAAELETVLLHEPDKLDALNDLAWTCQRLGRPQALVLAQRAHALAPDNPAIMDTLGWIHLEQGELARALPLLQQASVLAPLEGEIHFHLGMLLAQTGDKQHARRALEKALASSAPFRGRNDARTMLSLL